MHHIHFDFFVVIVAVFGGKLRHYQTVVRYKRKANCSFPPWTGHELPKRGHQTLRGKVLVARARVVLVLGLFVDGLGTVMEMVWGMVSLATRQTPQIDDNARKRGYYHV